MADFLQVVVLRRPGTTAPGARVSVVKDGEKANPQPVGDNGTFSMSLEPLDGAKLRVSVQPAASSKNAAWEDNDTAYWDVECLLDYSAASRSLTPSAGTTLPNEVAPIGKLQSSSTTFVVKVFLSRVRDITATARSVLAAHAADPKWKAVQLPTSEKTSSFLFTDKTLLASKKIQQVAATSDFANDRVKLLEVAPPRDAKGKAVAFAPKLVGIFFPDEAAKSDAPQVLYYLRPQIDQNFGSGPTGDKVSTSDFFLDRDASYAHASYYFDVAFVRTFFYTRDPWVPDKFYAAGLAHQVTASGKTVGVVAPLPEAQVANKNYGHAIEAGAALELIRECQAHARRALALSTAPPALARVAAASFSNGNDALHAFVNAVKAAATNDLHARLRETYILDPPPAYDADTLDACGSFLASVADGDPTLRFYGKFGPQPALIEKRDPFKTLHAALNGAVPTKAIKQDEGPHWTKEYASADAFDDTGSASIGAGKVQQPRTFAWLPPSCWPNRPPDGVGLAMHSFIPATMITHALRNSAFK